MAFHGLHREPWALLWAMNPWKQLGVTAFLWRQRIHSSNILFEHERQLLDGNFQRSQLYYTYVPATVTKATPIWPSEVKPFGQFTTCCKRPHARRCRPLTCREIAYFAPPPCRTRFLAGKSSQRKGKHRKNALPGTLSSASGVANRARRCSGRM